MKIKKLVWLEREDGGYYAQSPAGHGSFPVGFLIAFDEGKYWCIWTNEGEMSRGYDDPRPIMEKAQKEHNNYLMQFLEG